MSRERERERESERARASKTQSYRVSESKSEIYLYLRKHKVHLKGPYLPLPDTCSLQEPFPCLDGERTWETHPKKGGGVLAITSPCLVLNIYLFLTKMCTFKVYNDVLIYL